MLRPPFGSCQKVKMVTSYSTAVIARTGDGVAATEIVLLVLSMVPVLVVWLVVLAGGTPCVGLA